MSRRIERLRQAVQLTHDCEATHLESELVFLTAGNAVVWDGVVAVFKIIGHPTSKICYAWGYSEESDDQCVTVLGQPSIKSARAAVQAQMASHAKGGAQDSAPQP